MRLDAIAQGVGLQSLRGGVEPGQSLGQLGLARAGLAEEEQDGGGLGWIGHSRLDESQFGGNFPNGVVLAEDHLSQGSGVVGSVGDPPEGIFRDAGLFGHHPDHVPFGNRFYCSTELAAVVVGILAHLGEDLEGFGRELVVEDVVGSEGDGPVDGVGVDGDSVVVSQSAGEVLHEAEGRVGVWLGSIDLGEELGELGVGGSETVVLSGSEGGEKVAASLVQSGEQDGLV